MTRHDTRTRHSTTHDTHDTQHDDVLVLEARVEHADGYGLPPLPEGQPLVDLALDAGAQLGLDLLQLGLELRRQHATPGHRAEQLGDDGVGREDDLRVRLQLGVLEVVRRELRHQPRARLQHLQPAQ
jgi:hypothetical protein